MWGENIGMRMQDETISLKTDERGRVTIPGRIRERLGISEEQAWVRVTVHGLDPDEHPDRSSLSSGGDA